MPSGKPTRRGKGSVADDADHNTERHDVSEVSRGPAGTRADEAPARRSTSRAGPKPKGKPVPLDQEDDEQSAAAEEGEYDEEWDAPPGKLSGVHAPGEEHYETGEAYAKLDQSQDYATGSEYGSGSLDEKDLEGDGLDALEPDDLPPKTQNLKPEELEADEGAPEEGADDANATRAGPPLKLEITAGPDSGKYKKFRGVRMVIGRTPGVDLQLSDQSVSRKHVELVQGDKGVLLRDLGSGNGTKVNGAKVTEKLLEHGDEIHIGKTKLRFVDEVGAFQKAREAAEKKEAEAKAAAEGAPAEGAAEGEAAEGEAAEGEGEAAGEGEGEAAAEGEEGAAEEGGEGEDGEGEDAEEEEEGPPPPKNLIERFQRLSTRGKAVVAGAGGLVLLAILIGVALVLRPPPPAPPDPKQELAAQKIAQATEAMKAWRLEEALAQVGEAEKLVPGCVETVFKDKLRDELAIKKGLDEARALGRASRFDDARIALGRVAKGSVRADQEKKAVEAELVVLQQQYLKTKAEELVVAGEIEAAEQLLPQLSAADRAEVGGQLKQMKAELAAEANQSAAAKRNAQAAADAAAKAKKLEEMQAAFATVQRKFAGGEWARAASECDRVVDANPGDDDIKARARLLQQAIPAFGRAYEEGVKRFREGALPAAAKPLKKAREIYLQLGLPTPYGEELEEKLAQSALSAGKEAMLRDDLSTAAQYYREALKLDPSDGKAKQALDQLADKCDALYEQAYLIRDREPQEALRKFKLVVELTPSGTPLHEKARNQIAAMQP
ncbi:MAG: FHA domain-containing protein [Myxococcaceae bacterium]|nr:FHA domain-containing protein [Myxococcaceae bacterium]